MKKPTLFFKTFLISICSFFLFQCENEPFDKPIETFKKDSTIYKYLSNITDSNYELTCAYFSYPITLFTYDSNYQIVDETTITSDAEFLYFLSTISNSALISISYPVETILDDGTTFSINNNNELETNLEECYRERIIYNAAQLCFDQPSSYKCFWKVDYREDENNIYFLSSFESNGDGSFKFHHNNDVYNTSWSFIFLNGELHVNINMEGTSNIAQIWNHDWKVISSGPYDIIIRYNTTEFSLSRICTELIPYTIGEVGPAGGYIIYDKGYYSKGWRYIEVSPDYLNLNNIQWGCNGSSILNTNNTAIGEGLINTKNIINYHYLNNFYTNPTNCDPFNNGSVVAREVSVYSQNGYNDWLLPSNEECELIKNNLFLQGIGNITEDFWSSTEFDLSNAYYFSIGTENLEFANKTNNIIKIRPIRYF